MTIKDEDDFYDSMGFLTHFDRSYIDRVVSIVKSNLNTFCELNVTN